MRLRIGRFPFLVFTPNQGKSTNRANKTGAGSGSYGNCRGIDAFRSRRLIPGVWPRQYDPATDSKELRPARIPLE